ncbi:hypothetical protein FKM82_024626 [Ascaphus truei]
MRPPTPNIWGMPPMPGSIMGNMLKVFFMSSLEDTAVNPAGNPTNPANGIPCMFLMFCSPIISIPAIRPFMKRGPMPAGESEPIVPGAFISSLRGRLPLRLGPASRKTGSVNTRLNLLSGRNP